MQIPDTAAGPIFSADPAAFIGAIQAAGAPVERRNTIPILGNIHVAAHGNSVTVTGTDMDMDISATFPAIVERKGRTTIPAGDVARFAGAVRKSREVSCACDIRAKLSAPLEGFGLGFGDGDEISVTVPVIGAHEFPSLHGFDAAPTAAMSMKAVDWIGVLDAVSPCISSEETRYYLNGVYFHEVDGKWVAAATDGHRMMILKTKAEAPEGFSVIVPRKTITMLRQKLGKVPVDTVVTMELYGTPDHKLQWKFEDLVIRSKSIDGTFPDYDRVIPNSDKEGGRTIEIDTVAWSRMMRTVTALNTEKRSGARLSFSKTGCEVLSEAVDGPAIRTPLPCPLQTDEFSIGFQGRYLAAMCAAIAPRARVTIWDEASPIRFDSIGEDGAMERVGVLMPMRI